MPSSNGLFISLCVARASALMPLLMPVSAAASLACARASFRRLRANADIVTLRQALFYEPAEYGVVPVLPPAGGFGTALGGPVLAVGFGQGYFAFQGDLRALAGSQDADGQSQGCFLWSEHGVSFVCCF